VLVAEDIANDLLKRHPLLTGHQWCLLRRRTVERPTIMSAAVAGPTSTTRFRPERSYTTLWDVTCACSQDPRHPLRRGMGPVDPETPAPAGTRKQTRPRPPPVAADGTRSAGDVPGDLTGIRADPLWPRRIKPQGTPDRLASDRSRLASRPAARTRGGGPGRTPPGATGSCGLCLSIRCGWYPTGSSFRPMGLRSHRLGARG
jgi:hypothetical protein